MSDTPRPLVPNRGLPRFVANLVSRCLSKNRLMRPANGTELLAALTESSTGSRFPSLPLPTSRVWIATAAAIIIALLVAAGSAWRGRAGSEVGPLIAVLPFETEGRAPIQVSPTGLATLLPASSPVSRDCA
ncbi:MAG TPA: hypothetical protein VHT23_00730, partial [Gemmatimonadaceae bacterium]|nr:hypothetical protein [Gemmatimonadaceae bacterium]